MASSDTSVLLDTTDNRNQYDSLLRSSCKTPNKDQEFDSADVIICGIVISRFQLAILFSLIVMMVNICKIVLMPIYLADLVQAGSEPFTSTLVYNLPTLVASFVLVMLRWCHTRELPILRPITRYMTAAFIGFLSSIHNILTVFGSLPSRTRPELLGILSAALLPSTLILRYIIFQKCVEVKRLLCVAAVLLGLFISLIPSVFSLGTADGTALHDVNSSYIIRTDTTLNETNNTIFQIETEPVVVHGWVWPLVLVGATIIVALVQVIVEREIKSPEVSFITFIFWIDVFKNISLCALFWTALIPHFGLTTNIDDLLTSIGRGISCSFSRDPSSPGCLASGIISAILSPCRIIFVFLLTKYGEGAIYTTMIKTSSKPLTTIFWALFADSSVLGLIWRPQFNIYTILALVGVLIIFPAMCLYAYLSKRKDMSTSIILKETNERNTDNDPVCQLSLMKKTEQ